MKRTFTDRFFGWMAYRLNLAREKERQVALRHTATLATTAQIESEGTIENIFGDPNCINVGEKSHIRGRLLTYGHGGKISIGAWCYVGIRTEIWSMESIEIGNRVLISHDVNIHDGTAHSQNATERHEHYQHILRAGHPRTPEDMPGILSARIIIDDDVWISFGVTILKGVRIGAGSIIAANSIVTKDVPPHVIYRNDIVPVITPCSRSERL